MPSAQPLRRLQTDDINQLNDVYRDAVLTQAPGLYESRQIQAWADHADRSHAVALALREGYGLASLDGESIEAFGILQPPERLSLLYCRGRSCRQGRAGSILAALEAHSHRNGVKDLCTEASQLSRPLLERWGWQVDGEEWVRFAGVWFRRWRMIKHLTR